MRSVRVLCLYNICMSDHHTPVGQLLGEINCRIEVNNSPEYKCNIHGQPIVPCCVRIALVTRSPSCTDIASSTYAHTSEKMQEKLI